MDTRELTNTPEIIQPPRTSLLRDFATLLRYWVRTAWSRAGGRRPLILLGVAAVGTGLAFDWSWLKAIGAAPVILSLAPCAAMCALGLCMNKTTGGKSCSAGQRTDKGPHETAAQDMRRPRKRGNPIQRY